MTPNLLRHPRLRRVHALLFLPLLGACATHRLERPLSTGDRVTVIASKRGPSIIPKAHEIGVLRRATPAFPFADRAGGDFVWPTSNGDAFTAVLCGVIGTLVELVILAIEAGGPHHFAEPAPVPPPDH